MDKAAEKILEEIGLEHIEAKIYLALVELGETTAGDIAKKTNLQRSTTYLYLEKLIKLGLVSYIFRNNV